MDAVRRREFVTLLGELRDGVTRSLRARDGELDAIARSRGDAGADDEHDPEGTTLSEEWSRTAGLREDAERQLADIDAALARLAKDDYGVCALCGRAIPVARLRIVPTATRCVPCAEAVS